MSSPTAIYKAYYYHFDGLGSIIAVTDSTGNAVEAYRYSVYGLADKPTTAGNPYLFTGRQFDVETGLYYYRARYYSAAIDYLWHHSYVTVVYVCCPFEILLAGTTDKYSLRNFTVLGFCL